MSAASTAVASPATNVLADGNAVSTITVTVDGSALAGIPVALAASGSNHTLVQPAATDATPASTAPRGP